MSLRFRLFALLALLVALQVVAQWWLVRSMTEELSAELGGVAFSVGRSLVAALGEIEGRVERELVGAEGGRVEVEAQALVADDPADAGKGEAGEGRETRVVYHHRVVRRPAGGEGGEEDEPRLMVLKLRLNEGRGGSNLTLLGPRGETSIPIPESPLQATVRQFGRRLLLGTLAVLGLGLLGAALLAHRVAAPLERLAAAAVEVGEGELGRQVPVRAGGEAGVAIAAFNRMSRRLAELDESNRALRAREHLGELAEVGRGLAHSLRNPLNALGLSLEELAALARRGDQGESDGRAEDLAAAARRQIRRVDGALRSFLALASGGAAAAVPVDAVALARDVALEALQDAAGRGARVEVETETAAGGEPLALTGVEAELRAALQALVVNAVEASPQGGRVVVRVGRRSGASGVRITVEDEGPGLPEEVRRRLFAPHLSTKAHGSGMGLFLAHRIATTHYGGALSLRDKEGPPSGTRAELELGPRREVGDA